MHSSFAKFQTSKKCGCITPNPPTPHSLTVCPEIMLRLINLTSSYCFFAPKRGSKRNSDRSSINKVPLLKCIFNAHIYTYIRLDERDNNYKIAFLRHYSVYILQVNCNFDCSRHTKKLSRSLPLWRCTRCCIYKYKPTKKGTSNSIQYFTFLFLICACNCSSF